MGTAISIRNRYQCHVGTKQPAGLALACAGKFDTTIKILKLFMKYNHFMRSRRFYAHLSAARREAVSPANADARPARAGPVLPGRILSGHADHRVI